LEPGYDFLELLAYHEAGHAVAFVVHEIPILTASIGHDSAGPDTAGGVTPVRGSLQSFGVGATTQFAGPAATRMRISQLDWTVQADAEHRTAEAELFDCSQGWRCLEAAAERPVPAKTATLPSEVVDKAMNQATELLRTRWDAVTRVALALALALALAEAGSLTGDEVYALASDDRPNLG